MPRLCYSREREKINESVVTKFIKNNKIYRYSLLRFSLFQYSYSFVYFNEQYFKTDFYYITFFLKINVPFKDNFFNFYYSNVCFALKFVVSITLYFDICCFNVCSLHQYSVIYPSKSHVKIFGHTKVASAPVEEN